MLSETRPVPSLHALDTAIRRTSAPWPVSCAVPEPPTLQGRTSLWTAVRWPSGTDITGPLVHPQLCISKAWPAAVGQASYMISCMISCTFRFHHGYLLLCLKLSSSGFSVFIIIWFLAFFCDHRGHSSLSISPLYPLIPPMLLAV